jgi:chromosome segregation ATPase
VVLFWSCGYKQQNEMLQSKVDSLSLELQTSEEMAMTLQDVGVLIDSIDQNRKVLRSNIIEGTSYANYNERLKSINDFVKVTNKRIEEMELAIKKYKSGSNQYTAMVKKLKNDLQARQAEVAALEQSIATMKSENETLVLSVNEKQTIISEKDNFIQVKEKELANMEQQFREFTDKTRLTEGDLYFAQATALEEAAHRTKFAPRKKKSTQQEALELYRKALLLGKPEAQEKINELEKELS